MKVITVATQYSGYFYTLRESAKRFNYELIVLGYGMKWRGFGWRLSLILDYLRTLPTNEIIMVVDAYDVVLLRDSKYALKVFKDINANFLCGAFRKSEGIIGFIQEHEFGKPKTDLRAPYNNICAGTWISTAGNALDIFDRPEYQIEYKDDDQILFNRIYDESGSILADSDFVIFCTVFPGLITKNINPKDNIYITRDGVLRCGVTHTEPVLIHGLANAKLDSLLYRLGFMNYRDYTDNFYNLKKLWYHLRLVVKICIKKFLNY